MSCGRTYSGGQAYLGNHKLGNFFLFFSLKSTAADLRLEKHNMLNTNCEISISG